MKASLFLGIIFFIFSFIDLPKLKIRNKYIIRIISILCIIYGLFSIYQTDQSARLISELEDKMKTRFGNEFKEALLALEEKGRFSNEDMIKLGEKNLFLGVPQVDPNFYKQLPTTLLTLNLIQLTCVIDHGDNQIIYYYELTETGKKLVREFRNSIVTKKAR